MVRVGVAGCVGSGRQKGVDGNEAVVSGETE